MHADKKKRCQWLPFGNPALVEYHDTEWGVPLHDDQKLFEALLLAGLGGGLEPLATLVHREELRQTFVNFDLHSLVNYDTKAMMGLMKGNGLISGRPKISAIFINAITFREIQEKFGSFDSYIWKFVKGEPIINYWRSRKQVPEETPLSREISNDMRRRGFKYVSSTTVYSFMQAIGMVHDHTAGCFLARRPKGMVRERTDAWKLIRTLKLQKHPVEDGYFMETYRSEEAIPVPGPGSDAPADTDADAVPRSAGTAIYFMLVGKGFSEMHRLDGDEVYHFYKGDPVEMLLLYPDGTGKRVVLGDDIFAGMRPQVVIPAGTWQGSRRIKRDEKGYALVGTSMTPAFEYHGYQAGNREELLEKYPKFKNLIKALTKRTKKVKEADKAGPGEQKGGGKQPQEGS